MRTLLPALLLASSWCGPAAAQAPRVVATLPPVALIVEALTGDDPTVLASGEGGHEHGGSLRPSDARALAEADLVLWIGPSLEPGVAAALTPAADEIALARAEGVPRRAGAGGVPDPHAWLDPAGMAAMATAAANVLSDALPETVSAVGLIEALDDVRGEVAARMAPLADRPYAVEHDAFRHFAEAFGLAEPLAFGEGAVGARTLRAARREVAERGITCLIVEPGEPSRLAAALGDEVRAVVIDPLGRDAESPADLIERVASGFEECLGDRGS